MSELLKKEGELTITGVTRHNSSYTAPTDSSIIHKKVDYESFDSLVEAFSDQDAVVNCITGSATQFDPSKRIIDACIAAKVKFFFANEFVGHVTREQYRRLPEAFVGGKYRIRQYMEGLGKEGKITWTSLTGGPFFDMWVAKGPAGFDIANRHARIYGTGDNPLCWTPLPIMGVAAANMLRKPAAVANRPIHICPFRKLTQNHILATLESVLGTKFTVEKVDVKKINEHARIALDRGEAGKAMKGLAVSNQFYEGDSGNDFSELVENNTVGVEMMTVEDAIKDVIARYGEDSKVVEAMFKVEPCEV